MTGWFKSSYSGGDNNCVEASHAPADFHKSSYSGAHGECVEVAEGPITGIRDTKHRELGALFFGSDEWHAFIGTARSDVH